MAKAFFEEMDYNHDNMVTKDEFLKACVGYDKLSAGLAFKLLDVCTSDGY